MRLSYEESRKVLFEIEDKLDEKYKKFLLQLFSEVSETSYRRGVQQAICAMNGKSIDDWIMKDDAYTYRYGKDVQVARGLDGYESSAEHRLIVEHPELEILKGMRRNKKID